MTVTHFNPALLAGLTTFHGEPSIESDPIRFERLAALALAFVKSHVPTCERGKLEISDGHGRCLTRWVNGPFRAPSAST